MKICLYNNGWLVIYLKNLTSIINFVDIVLIQSLKVLNSASPVSRMNHSLHILVM